MAPFQKARMAAVIGLVVVLGAGCSLAKTKTASIDAPPVSAEEMMNASPAPGATQAKGTAQVTLYFKDQKGYMAPISMAIPNENNAVARKSLEYLVEDGPAQALLPTGFTAVLPKGTQVKAIDIQNKVATVDFSKEFLSYNVQDERKILEAITYTLTGFPTVEKVQLWVEGKALKEMPVDGYPLDNPLSRSMGVNIELTNGVDIGQSMPVTVFFRSQTADNFGYYVPVTRMVKRSDNAAQAAMEQLIQGPNLSKGLQAVIQPSTQLLNVTQSADKSVVTVNLNDKFLGTDKKASDEAVQAVILSLTENTGASKVQLEVNGDAKVSTQSATYSNPVSRPNQVNPLKL
jgi:germination protein M